MTKENQFLERIKEGESVFQEFKTSLEKVDRPITAFANAYGGTVYLGVDDLGNFTPNFKMTNKLKAQIQDISRNIDPPVELTVIDLKKACAIIIKEGEDKPYKCKDGFYMRVGATSQKLSRDEILDLAVKLNKIRFETLQRLDFKYPRDFSKNYFENYIKMANLEDVTTNLGQDNTLISLGLAEKHKSSLIFNNAGILHFATNPQKFIPQAKVSYARYKGENKSHVVDRMIFTGPVQYQIQEVLKRLQLDVPVSYELEGMSGRKEIPLYPLRALDEAIVNAIIHRDYFEEGAEILVDYYSNRIEISNPGELLGKMSVLNLGTKTLRRNPIVADLLFRIGKGEKLGSGISRMKSLMKDWNLKEPLFESANNFFSISLFGPQFQISINQLNSLPSRPQVFMKKINQVEQPFSANTYAQMFKVTVRAAQIDLAMLLKKKLISKEGKGKNTRYRVV